MKIDKCLLDKAIRTIHKDKFPVEDVQLHDIMHKEKIYNPETEQWIDFNHLVAFYVYKYELGTESLEFIISVGTYHGWERERQIDNILDF